MAIQLIQRGLNTNLHLNNYLRNKKHINEGSVIVLRDGGENTNDFRHLDFFKHLVLDLARQANADYIQDIVILDVPPGGDFDLKGAEDRYILILSGTSSFSAEDGRFTPEIGDLLWTNSDCITINNNTTLLSLILVLDVKEFKI